MTQEGKSRALESLRDQCAGLSASDIRTAELIKLIIRTVKEEGAKGCEITLASDGGVQLGVDLEGMHGC